MKKKLFIIITIIGLFLLTGCGKKLEAYNPISEEELIEYVKEEIYKNTGDEVDVEIKSKKPIKLCAANINLTCFGPKTVPDSYSYYLIITSKTNPEVTSDYNNYYSDSYKEDGKIRGQQFSYEGFAKAYLEYNRAKNTPTGE